MFTKTEIINRLKDDIIKNNLISKKDTIIIGASGGPDSQFLIYTLKEVQKEFDFNIVLCHLNHLHRQEAVDDENLLIETAKSLDLNYYVERKSMDELAKKEKISPEDAGRRLRYDFFRRIAAKYPNSKIAVGHNKDDQAETILMRIIRGTGVDGLRAMDYKSKDIIRPILSFSKEEILSYLDRENIVYAIDHTNLETDYTRNKIRLEIIPGIEEINPGFKDSLINLSLIAKDEVSIIESIENKSFFSILNNEDENHISFERQGFEKLDNPLKARIIRKAIERLNKSLKNYTRLNTYDFVSLTDKETGKVIENDSLVFQKNYKTYDLYRKEIFEKRVKSNFEKNLQANDEILFGSYKINTKVLDKEKFTKSKKKNRVFFDYQSLDFPLIIRTRKSGDRFTAFDNGGTKKLKDFFIDEKIDRKKRDTIPLILSKDKIIWIAPFRRSSDYKVDNKTEKILMIELEEVWLEI